MGRRVLEEASFSLVKLAILVAVLSCGLPFWRVMRFSEETISWEGLWVLCEANGLKSLRCMSYSSHLVQSQDLQVSCFLVVICITITWLGLVLYKTRDEPISWIPNMNNEEQIKMLASSLFLGAGLLLVVSVSWVTHNVILAITNPQMVFPWKPEMGFSLYLGWVSSLLLLLGGALLGGALLWCPAPNNNEQPFPTSEGSYNVQLTQSEGSREGSSPGTTMYKLGQSVFWISQSVDSSDHLVTYSLAVTPLTETPLA